MKIKFTNSLFMDQPHHTARYFGGGSPIVMGGMTDAEMQAQLNQSALENEKMLSMAADQQAELQRQLDERDAEMELMMKQQAATVESDMARAQKALDVELESLGSSDAEDDLAADFSVLEDALASGLGGGAARPE